MVLQFDDDGMLPPGEYVMTVQQLRESILVSGPGERCPAWDSEWRRHLVDNLEVLAAQLWSVGVTNVYVDGSFAEDKDHPKDIDGYFECDIHDLASGELQRKLNSLDPHHVWTWDPAARRPHSESVKLELPMWHRYRVELYPHFGQPCGIPDEFGNELEFPAAFRKSRRSHRAKGIIKLEAR